MLDAVPQLSFFLDLPAVPVDLGPARDPGLDEMTHHVLPEDLGEAFRVQEHMGPGANHRHIAFQDVEKLREFIQVGLAEEPSQPGKPAVVFRHLPDMGVRIDGKGPEFVAKEFLIVFPRAPLYEKYGTGRVQLDQDGQHRDHPGQ